jgi:NAD(P)-dependent dehydrogenase (short-subunit alcohol dehydrogenase family)
MEREVALITGASSGIGRELTRLFAGSLDFSCTYEGDLR